MSNAAKFWDKIAEKYAQRPVPDEDAYDYKLTKTQEFLRPDMDVLEFGCGTGTTALHHAPHVHSYRAIDISAEMIRIARAKPGAEQVRFEVADFDEIELAPEGLDMIQAHSILHLLPDPEASLSKAYTALKPGGKLVSSTVCVKHLWWLRLLLPLARALGKAPPLKFYAPDDVRKMINEAGFAIVHDWQSKPGSLALFVIARKPG